MREKTGDYEIGYRKPPLHTRFQKGRSGNPRGRASASLAELINKALNRETVVTVDGKRRRISKREAIVAQLIDRSAAADLRATKLLLDVVKELEKRAGAEAAAPAALAPADRAVIAHLLARLRGEP
ncbi:MAG TPA: DUF5681 domain-containing protein [Stellaceae bacterium]|nr:DUF5681 domain-containing protein [Stellaceae bacterium]